MKKLTLAEVVNTSVGIFMVRIYSEEEERTHLDKYKLCGKTKTEYAKMIYQKVDFKVDSMHDKTI